MIQKPRGTIDILPDGSKKWQYIENTIYRTCDVFGYKEIKLPTFEATELFTRGVGGTTDVVQKEMYTFTDRENRSFTLRPEGTAGVMRSVIENKLYSDALPLRLFYYMNCFRYEKPQAGRSREYFTFGIEQLGAESAAADVEVIMLAEQFIKKFDIKYRLLINTIGCKKCRPEYQSKLKDYLDLHKSGLCGACKERMERNPLRVLDCKTALCKDIVENAPKSKDCLCGECSDHFSGVRRYLKISGIEYEVNPLIVRGLDYYMRTVFEFVSDDIGAQSTICGGGRYDGLLEMLGGPKMPGMGFGIGISRLIMAAEANGFEFPANVSPTLYIASIPDTDGNSVMEAVTELMTDLLGNGISAETDIMGRSLKAQMKYADKIRAKYTYIIGKNEVEKKSAILKDMKTSEQKECPFDEIKKFIRGAEAKFHDYNEWQHYFLKNETNK